MDKRHQEFIRDDDPGAADRKEDHIDLAFRSQVNAMELDSRFYYEPALSAHPAEGSWPAMQFLGKTLRVPIWVSSMTGGTGKAGSINRLLAQACAEFGMGMGLGSCRALLSSDKYLDDFMVRPVMGHELPLYANLGIAQVESLIADGKTALIGEMTGRLQADGLIVHVNPLQEWLQPEGDRIRRPPVDTLAQLLELTDLPVIVKEVGQGMGPASLRALLALPLAAVDLAAHGGTNFSRLELLRSDPVKQDTYAVVSRLGHSAVEMTGFLRDLCGRTDTELRCRQIILSGGVRDFLDGYYLLSRCPLPAVYGQASGFLKYAMQGDYEALRSYVAMQLRGLELARAFLRIRS